MHKFARGDGSILDAIRRLGPETSGATAIEYAILASGISVAIASTIYNLGSTVSGFYASVAALF